MPIVIVRRSTLAAALSSVISTLLNPKLEAISMTIATIKAEIDSATAKLSEQAQTLANIDADTSRLLGEIDALKVQITDLQAQVANADVPADLQASVDALASQADAVTAAAQAIDARV